ncbi:hypothetical protein F5887DRAFT_987360, partial [Amanita rubescens]
MLADLFLTRQGQGPRTTVAGAYAGIQPSSMAITVTNLHDFLAEHATLNLMKINRLSTPQTYLSFYSRGKVKHAVGVGDNTLVQELCSALENIHGDTLLVADQLLAQFSPRIQFSALRLDRESKRKNC